MGHIILNLGEVARNGIVLALKTMFKLEPDERPHVEMEMVSEARLYASHDTFAALIILGHRDLDASGYLALLLPKQQGKFLLSKIGITNPSPADVEDFAGEFCNIIAGTFKTEVIKLGLGSIEITLPKIFTEGIDKEIENVEVDTMYTVTVPYDGQTLLTVEVAFQSKGEKEKETLS